MNDPVRTVEIDRIILTDLGVSPDRAERIRILVEMELQRLLERQGWPDGLVSSEIPSLTAPAMPLPESHSDSHLASSLALGIAQALGSVGSSEAGGEQHA